MRKIILLTVLLIACGDSRLSPQGGTITGATTGGGLLATASRLGLKTTCSTTQVLAWDGDSWECAASGDGTPSMITAPAIVGTVNDWSPTGYVAATDGIRVPLSGAATITGITGGVDGRVLTLINTGGGDLVIDTENAGSVAANRITNPTNAYVLLQANDTASYVYDGSSSRWRPYTSTSHVLPGPYLFYGGSPFGVQGPATFYNTLNIGSTSGYASGTLAAGTTENWSPTGLSAATVIRVTTDTFGSTLGGLAAKNVGDVVILENHGDGSGSRSNGDLKLLHRSGGSSVANQFVLSDLADVIIPYTGSIMLYYDAVGVGWIPFAASQGGRFERVTANQVDFKPLTPTALAAGNNNNWNPTSFGTHSLIQLSANTGAVLTGMTLTTTTGFTNYAAGHIKILENVGSASILITDEDANSTDLHRFALPNGSFQLAPKDTAVFVYYNGGTPRWHLYSAPLVESKDTYYTAVTDTGLAATVNDYNPTGFSYTTRLRLAPSGGSSNITGLVAQEDGAVRVITCYGGTITLAHQDVGSSAANRFYLPAASLTLVPGDSVTLVYDALYGAWFPGGTTPSTVSGDITGVTANAPISGGGTTGTVAVGLTTCAADQIYKMSGGVWTCSADAGGTSYTAGDGLTLTVADFDITYTSDFTITTDQLDLSTAVTAPGTLNVAGNTTLGDGAADIMVASGNVSKFGTNGFIYFDQNTFNYQYASDSDQVGYINYSGYNGGITRFRSLQIDDGKQAAIALFDGATKATTLYGALSVAGNTTIGDAVGDLLTVVGDTSLLTSSGSMYGWRETFNFGYAVNSAYTGYINYYGYATGVSQFRNLEIMDGKGAAIAIFSGSDKGTALKGALSVDGNTTLGNATSDTVTIKGAVTVEPPASSKGVASHNVNTAQTGNVHAMWGRSSGTFNTTSSSILNVGVFGQADATRSSGANTVYDYGILGVSGSVGDGSVEEYGVGSQGVLVVANAISGAPSAPAFVASPHATNGGFIKSYGQVLDASTAPTLSTCGTSPSVTGGMHGFVITVGTGSPGSCTFTFATSFASTPACVATTINRAFETYFTSMSSSAGTVDINTTSFNDGDKIHVICVGDA